MTMKYIGPYDEVTIEGKVYHPGDAVDFPPERLEVLRRHDGYQFRDDAPDEPPAPPAPEVPPVL